MYGLAETPDWQSILNAQEAYKDRMHKVNTISYP